MILFSKKSVILLTITAVLTISAFTLFYYNNKNAEAAYKRVSGYEVIDIDKVEQLIDSSGTNRYVVQGITLSGEPVKDGLGCLAEEYAAITAECYVCDETTYTDGEYEKTDTQWNRAYSEDKLFYSDGLVIPYTDASAVKNCEFVGIELGNTELKRGVKALDGNYFYPSGNTDNVKDNIRYSYSVIPFGRSYSAFAEIGMGKVTYLSEIEPYNCYTVFFEGNAERAIDEVRKCAKSEAAGILLITLFPSIALLIWAIVELVKYNKE